MTTAVPPVRIVLLAKAPLPGRAKTRLIPALGADGAADLAARLLQHAIGECLAAAVGPVQLCVTPGRADPAWRALALPRKLHWTEQGEGDLGARMARAAQRVTAGGEAVLLIGSDCPGLTAECLRAAARALADHDSCLIPASDGGYVLLGLRHHLPALFADMPWSTPAVAGLTCQRIRAAGCSLKQFPLLHDIDEPQDLAWLPAQLQP